MYAALDSWVSSRFVSVEETLYVKQKLDCVLWLAELTSHTRVWLKFNQVYTNQTAPIYRSVMRWDKGLEQTGSVLRQHGLPRRTVSQENVERIRGTFQKNPVSLFAEKVYIRPTAINCSWCFVQKTEIAWLQASAVPKHNTQISRFKNAVCMRNAFPRPYT